MGKQTYKVCFCFWRRFQVAVSEPPEPVKSLFNQYSVNGIMTVDDLHRFLIEVQKESNPTKEDAQGIIVNSINNHHHQLKHLENTFNNGKKGLDLEAFFKYYLFSCNNNPPLSPSLGVHHDMSAPLSHYFIFTGHNSYLTGNQINSVCSDVPIKDALVERGVRGIELDLWPNSKKDHVEVRHGGTLTPPVELITCLKTIKEYAFVASDYPVIITFEDHLTHHPHLQAKVAEMVTQTFDDQEILFSPPGSDQCFKEFPSPESLKRKIIISTKPPQKKHIIIKDDEAKEEIQIQSNNKTTTCCGSIMKKMFKRSMHQEEEYPRLSHSDDSDEEEEEDETHDERAVVATRPEYAHLISIQCGKPEGGLKEWLKVDDDKVRRLSLSELQLQKAVEKYGNEIVRFTQRNILRVYPKGTRIYSSNYNPLIAWTHGAQMVAFNMQGYGRPLWLMHGMFRANGGCGFVKKPDLLLKPLDPHVKLLPVKTTLRVTVYAGEGWYDDFKLTHFDSYSPPDFYARVGIAGVPSDTSMKRTETMNDNWVPAWNESFEFPLTVPEIGLLRIEVLEEDLQKKDDFGGQTCLPVSELRQGIRAVPLHNRKGEMYKTVKLLMRFEFI